MIKTVSILIATVTARHLNLQVALAGLNHIEELLIDMDPSEQGTPIPADKILKRAEILGKELHDVMEIGLHMRDMTAD